MTYNSDDRIGYVERHAGRPLTREWAMKAARHYRRAVLGGIDLCPDQRRLFIHTYLELKRYAFGGN